MTDETLILRLRAETLETNLTRLKDHFATPDRIVNLNNLLQKEAAIFKSLDNVEEAWRALSRKIDRGEQIGWDEKVEPDDQTAADASTVQDTFYALQRELDEARKSLRSLQSSIEQMKRECFQVEEREAGKEIVQDLRNRTEPLIAQLGGIEMVGNTPEALASGWEALLGKVAQKVEPLLMEYIELLGGAALRDSGFDAKISSFADELLRATDRKLLALPTPMRRNALITTIKRIVRVTFPDWTVWALPAAALEFWNVVEYDNLKETLNARIPADKQDVIKAEDWNCLGNAYATYTMGPAYAYYAVGLLLAPDSEEDQSRVRAILAMLELMQESPGGSRYRNVRLQLLNAWNAACDQWGKPALKVDVDKSDDADKQDPEGAGVRVLIRVLWSTLESQTSSKFTPEIWNEINKKDGKAWAALLLANEPDQIEIPNGVELRHLLNAAWLARVDPARPSSVKLNEAVKRLQARIQERQQRRGK